MNGPLSSTIKGGELEMSKPSDECRLCGDSCGEKYLDNGYCPVCYEGLFESGEE